jgi:hypothetical protein
MKQSSNLNSNIIIRNARIGDIRGIVALVATCAPYLTKHGDYLYLIYTRCFSDTCAVAVDDGKIVGWCSMLPIGRSTLFLHQLGVLPETRGSGIAFALFTYMLTKMRARYGGDLAIEFTTDRRNHQAQGLNLKVAEAMSMRLEKLAETVPVLEDGCDEELYRMTPLHEAQLVAPDPFQNDLPEFEMVAPAVLAATNDTGVTAG